MSSSLSEISELFSIAEEKIKKQRATLLVALITIGLAAIGLVFTLVGLLF